MKENNVERTLSGESQIINLLVECKEQIGELRARVDAMEKTNLTATVVALDSSVTDLEEEFEEIDDKLTDMQDELNRVRKSIEFGASEFLRKEKEEQLTK